MFGQLQVFGRLLLIPTVFLLLGNVSIAQNPLTGIPLKCPPIGAQAQSASRPDSSAPCRKSHKDEAPRTLAVVAKVSSDLLCGMTDGCMD